MIYVLLLGLLMFIRFAARGTAVFYDLCVIVRVVDVYQIWVNSLYLSGLPQNKPGSPDIAEKQQKVTVNTNKPNNNT
jgi:hypothetical protein